MTAPEMIKKDLSFVLPSNLLLVHRVVQGAEAFLRQHKVGDTTRVAVVLHELISNAILHGNKSISHRTVKCHIGYEGGGRFRITVEDEGEGFDPINLDTSLPGEAREIGKRGYVLIRNICSELEFNKRGNRVTVVVDLQEKPRSSRMPVPVVLPLEEDDVDEDEDEDDLCGSLAGSGKE